MVTAIMSAAADPHVHGMILAFNDSMIEHRGLLTGEIIESHLGMGVLDELQTAIATFRLMKEGQRLQRMADQLQGTVDRLDNEQLALGMKEIPVVSRHDVLERVPLENTVIAISDNYCAFSSSTKINPSFWI